MPRPNPMLIAQGQKKLFDAIVAEFPLSAISDGASVGIGFNDETVEEINKAFFPMVNGKSFARNKVYTSFIVGRQPLLEATQNPTKTMIITDNLEDLITATLGFLKGSISGKLEPDYNVFMEEVTGGRGFYKKNGRPRRADGASSTYLSALAGAKELYGDLEKLNVSTQKSLAKTPAFAFLKKIAKSNIPKLATELLILIEPPRNLVSDEALFKKLANEFYLTDTDARGINVRDRLALFREAVEFVKGVREEMRSVPDYANPIAAIHDIMTTAAFIFIELPSTYTTSLFSAKDYSSFRSRYTQGFAHRDKLYTPESVKLNDLAGFALYAIEGLKQIQEKELPLIRPLVKTGVVKGIDINIFNRIEQSVREMRDLIKQSGIEEDFRNYRDRLTKSASPSR